MQKLFVAVLCVLCAACAKEHGKPIASLSYTDITVKPGTGLYDLRFKSDVDLLNLFQRDESPVGGMLHCALADDTNFAVDHVMKESGYGAIQVDSQSAANGNFAFVATIFFKETFKGGRSTRTLTDTELHGLLSGKQAIPCKYVATAYGFKPYYSDALMVPTQDILREVDR